MTSGTDKENEIYIFFLLLKNVGEGGGGRELLKLKINMAPYANLALPPPLLLLPKVVLGQLLYFFFDLVCTPDWG